MDEKNFDKKIKNILGNPPSFEMPPAALDDMKKRLNEEMPNKKTRGLALMWLPLLLLPFLLGGLYLYFSNQAMKQELEQFKSQLLVIQEDSLITRRKITYQYDTIYNTIYKDIIVERRYEKVIPSKNTNYINRNYNSILRMNSSADRWSNLNPLFYRNLGDEGPDMLNPSSNSNFYTPRFNPFYSYAFDNANSNNKSTATRRLNQFSTIPSLNHNLISSNPYILFEHDSMQVIKLNKAPEVNPLLYLSPTGIDLGITYSPLVFANTPGGSNSRSYGLTAEIKFPHPLRLQVGFEKIDANFYTKDPADYAAYPIPSPNNPNDLLEEAKGSFSYLQIPVSLKWVFAESNKFSPFIQGGIVARKPFRQSFNAEYLSPLTGEYTNQSNFSDGDFSIENIRAGLGVEYSFLQKFTASSSLFYQSAFETTDGDYFKLRYFGLGIGLSYQL